MLNQKLNQSLRLECSYFILLHIRICIINQCIVIEQETYVFIHGGITLQQKSKFTIIIKHSKSVQNKYRDTVSYCLCGIAILSRYIFSGDTQL